MFNFPWTNFHELNLDWILSVVKEAKEVFDNGRADIDYAVDTADEAKNIATQAAQATIADNSISTAKLQDYAVTNQKISNLAITSDKLQSGCILNAKIADNAVTSPKIADGSVTLPKLASSIFTGCAGLYLASTSVSIPAGTASSPSTYTITVADVPENAYPIACRISNFVMPYIVNGDIKLHIEQYNRLTRVLTFKNYGDAWSNYNALILFILY